MVRIPLPGGGRYVRPHGHGPAAVSRIADQVQRKLRAELGPAVRQLHEALKRESEARRSWQREASLAIGRRKRETDALADRFRTFEEALRCAEDELIAQGILTQEYVRRFRAGADQPRPRIPRGRAGEEGDGSDAQAA